MQPRQTLSRFPIVLVISIVALTTLVHCPAIFAAPDTATVAASGGLRMRTAPDLESKRILTIPDGATVSVRQTRGATIEIGGQRGQWTEVEFNGKTGWVFGGFLHDARPSDLQPTLSSRDRAVLKKIRELTGVVVPEKSAGPVRGPVHGAEQYDLDLFAVLKQQTVGEITVFTIAPNGKECEFYGDSDCINIIAGKNKTYIVSDVFRSSFGFPDAVRSGAIVFRVGLGEGDVCFADGEGEHTAYILAQKKFVVQSWRWSRKCTCCTAESYYGMGDCPCNQYTQTHSASYSGLDGEKIVITPEIERLFRQDDAGR